MIKGYKPADKKEEDKNDDKEKDISAEEKKKLEEKQKAKIDRGCTTEEIVAVLGHELGHWKYSHTIKMLVIMEVGFKIILWFLTCPLKFSHHHLFSF